MSYHSPELAKIPSPPPPAPPLPPQRQQGFVANALARVAQPFGYGARLPTPTRKQAEEPRPSRLGIQSNPRWAPEYSFIHIFTGKSTAAQKSPVSQGSCGNSTDKVDSPVSSRTTTHKTGIPINALDISPDRTQAVLAGHNILKTVQVSDTNCAEVSNLRAKIIGYAAAHENSGNASTPKRNEHLVANDVKWSHGLFGSTIATAAATGQIIIYDINRASVEIARLHEHSRQVNKLGFNPHNGQLLLSGDQDGIVRLWDLRALANERNVATCQSVRKFTGNSNSIRDLRWSPTNGVEFAFCTDNGTVQRWDFRHDKNPQLRVNAHSRQCYSIDWHPDGKHLVSGGQDRNIRIWDFSSSDRKKKFICEIRAPQEVRNVRWRPACWSSAKHGPVKWRCSQIAASYDQQDPRIDIWDFRRPSIPFLSLHQYDTPASGLLWHSESLLWSVGSAGIFTQIDTKFVPRTVDRRSPNTLAVSPDGQILHFSQKRERRQAPFGDALDGEFEQSQRRNSAVEMVRGSHSNGRGLYQGQSLLNPAFISRQRKQLTTTKPSRSTIGQTATTGADNLVEGFEVTMRANNLHSSIQNAAIGHVEGAYDSRTFLRLTQFRIPDVPKDHQARCKLHEILADAIRYNAQIASSCALNRLSQSLHILAKAVVRDLTARADMNLQRRFYTEAQSLIEPTVAASGQTLQLADDVSQSQLTQEPDSSGLLPPTNGTISSNREYILQDFMTTGAEDEINQPFKTSNFIAWLIEYHFVMLKDVQLPIWLILYIGPWFRYSNILPADTILKVYHQQLKDRDLLMQACELRKGAFSTFGHNSPLRSLSSLEHRKPRYFCYNCMKTAVGSNPFKFCERCKTRHVTCPICLDQLGGLHRWCQGCGHWAHVKCMEGFWKPGCGSEGMCPLIGCNHLCSPWEKLPTTGGDSGHGGKKTVRFDIDTQK